MEKQSDFIQCDYLFEDQTVEIIAKQIDAAASVKSGTLGSNPVKHAKCSKGCICSVRSFFGTQTQACSNKCFISAFIYTWCVPSVQSVSARG